MKKKLPTPQKLPSGVWRCQVMIDGKRVSVTDENPKVAQAKAVALREGIIERTEEKKPKSITLEEAIEAYVESKEAVLSPASARSYMTIKRNRFPSLMKQNIFDLAKPDIQKAINVEAKRVSAKTVKNAYGLVQSVLKENGVEIPNINLPQCIKPNKRYLQPDDIEKLIEESKGDSCETEILIAAWLGLRRSEIMGICWDCVDFDRKTITIRRAVVPDKNNKWVLKDFPKNESSQRTISCPDYIMEKFRERYKEGNSGRVFRGHPDTLRRHIHKVCERAGITDTTVHGLRHTNAAVMKSLGISDAHAMARGGWKNEQTYKKTYSYVFDQDAKESDEAINSFFEKMHTNLHTK